MTLRICLWAVAAALGFSLCAQSAGAQTKLKVVFPTTPTTMAWPSWIAMEKGWREDGGVEIEAVRVQGDRNAIRALSSGQADIADSGTFPVYGAIASGAQMKAIASWQPI